MEDPKITVHGMELFEKHLWEEEKSPLTVEKYLRDVRSFCDFVHGETVTRMTVRAYKNYLIGKGYAPGSINSMLASLNSLFRFLGMEECRVKNIRVQKKTYCSEEEELTREEYARLVRAAGKGSRMGCILEAICSTGIRISELKYFTVEAVKKSEITVTCKGKTRTIILPRGLKKLLLAYAARTGTQAGVIFRTRNGKPLNRSNIWAWMKKLCANARVSPSKVFPHNLRKLFARTFYRAERDIAKLADVLGHSSIDTTRIYIISTGHEHRKKIERLHLLI